MNVKMMLNYIYLQCYYFQLVILSKKIIINFFRFLITKLKFIIKTSCEFNYNLENSLYRIIWLVLVISFLQFLEDSEWDNLLRFFIRHNVQ